MVPSILKDYFFSPQGLNLKPLVRTPKDDLPSMAMSHLKMFNHPDAKAMVKTYAYTPQSGLTVVDIDDKRPAVIVKTATEAFAKVLS